MSIIEKQLENLGITLPQATLPAANYVPCVQSGNLLFVSGQLPFKSDGTLMTGLVESEVSIEQAKEAAKLCAIHILSQAKLALGSLDKISRIVKLGGFVASNPTFHSHPAIINGASDLIVAVFGDKGRHARVAMGVAALPLNACVEVEAIIEINS